MNKPLLFVPCLVNVCWLFLLYHFPIISIAKCYILISSEMILKKSFFNIIDISANIAVSILLRAT